MRCLGRLVVVLVLAALLAAAWFYRGELRRAFDHSVTTAPSTAHAGRPSLRALRRALAALDSLRRSGADSVIMTDDEMASLLVRGADFLPGVSFDSISVELGDGSIAIRTLIDSARVPSSLRVLLPGAERRYQEVRVSGTLTPIRPGLAEFDAEHVTVHGVPLPGPLLDRVADKISGRSGSRRIEIALPPTVGGFRVHPASVTIYGAGAGR